MDDPTPTDGRAEAASVERVSLPALLAETFTVQALGTTAVLIVPTLAPAVARALAVPVSQIGFQVSLVYVAAMLMSLVAGTLVASFGPCRTGQIAMGLTATGCVLVALPHLAAVILGSLVIGSAYGLINPAASELLVRYSPPERRNLIFSIKQTGVPFGGMVAGLLGPSLALTFGWRAVLVGIAAASLIVAAAAQKGRAVLDRGRGGAGRPSGLSLAALATVAKTPSLRWLALASFCFSAVQLCVVAFLVALLVEDLGFDLVTAGVVLAGVQLAGAAGRLLWGWVADAVRDGLAVLLGLALVMAAMSAVVMAFVPGWPPSLAVLPFLVLGLSAVGWNGVYLSEIARLSAAGSVSATTGAAMFFTFTGVVFGPSLLSLFHASLGSYVRSYGLLAVVSLAGGILVAMVRSRRSRQA